MPLPPLSTLYATLMPLFASFLSLDSLITPRFR
jgi:hypothetical protein